MFYIGDFIMFSVITEEMPETDAEGTLRYILFYLSRGKTVTLGACKFKSA